MSKELGDCYEANAKLLLRLSTHGLASSQVKLCHGTALGTGGNALGVRFGHCWVELDAAIVLDESNGNSAALPRNLYYEAGQIEDVIRYSPLEVKKMLVRHKHWGPWHEEEAEIRAGVPVSADAI